MQARAHWVSTWQAGASVRPRGKRSHHAGILRFSDVSYSADPTSYLYVGKKSIAPSRYSLNAAPHRCAARSWSASSNGARSRRDACSRTASPSIDTL